MISKRSFNYLTAFGVLSCLGCNSQRLPTRVPKKLQKVQFPYGFSFCSSLLPDYDFKHEDIESSDFDRDRRESEDVTITISYENSSSLRGSLSDIDQIKSLAIVNSLAERDHEIIRSLAESIDLRKFGANLRFSVIGPVLNRRINSIDLVGVRKPNSKFSFSRGEVDPRLKMEPVLSPRVFELLSRIQPNRAFFNYSRCELNHFLGWLNTDGRAEDEIECIGLPVGFSVSEVRLVLKKLAPPILDLSGYEDDILVLARLVSLAGEFGVKWVTISDYVDFDWCFLARKLEEMPADSPSVNGIIGFNTIAVLC